MKIIINKNPWFSLEKHDLPFGGEYYFINKRPTVFVVAETVKKEIIMINEYRFPINKNIWQLPAGMMEHESPLVAAKRELFEETGFESKEWSKLGEFFVAPGHENTKIIVFLAKNLITTINSYKTLETDVHKIKRFSKSKIEEMIRGNKILCSISLAALNLYFISKNRI